MGHGHWSFDILEKQLSWKGIIVEQYSHNMRFICLDFSSISFFSSFSCPPTLVASPQWVIWGNLVSAPAVGDTSSLMSGRLPSKHQPRFEIRLIQLLNF